MGLIKLTLLNPSWQGSKRCTEIINNTVAYVALLSQAFLVFLRSGEQQHVCFPGLSSSCSSVMLLCPHPPPIGWQPSKQLQLQSPPPLQRAAGYLITPIPHSLCLPRSASSRTSANTSIMTGVAAASFFSNVCRFGGCGLHFESLGELIVHIEDNHIGEWRFGFGLLSR